MKSYLLAEGKAPEFTVYLRWNDAHASETQRMKHAEVLKRWLRYDSGWLLEYNPERVVLALDYEEYTGTFSLILTVPTSQVLELATWRVPDGEQWVYHIGEVWNVERPPEQRPSTPPLRFDAAGRPV